MEKDPVTGPAPAQGAARGDLPTDAHSHPTDMDCLAQHGAGERSRLSGRRGHKGTSRAHDPRALSRKAGGSAKAVSPFEHPRGHPTSRHRRADLRKYVAHKNRRCRAPGIAATLEAEDEGRVVGNGEDGSREAGAVADGGELRPSERSMDDITWLLEASRMLGGRGAGPARGEGVPASRLLPASSSAFSARSSEGWEVVDGTFDVRSMEDVELG
eukprot:evm.model.scf_1286.3 EVM.evm.TU.scf_1286.3   scf_1286:18017-18658(+)